MVEIFLITRHLSQNTLKDVWIRKTKEIFFEALLYSFYFLFIILFYFIFFRAIARLRIGDRPADVLLKDVESGDRSAVTGRSIG